MLKRFGRILEHRQPNLLRRQPTNLSVRSSHPQLHATSGYKDNTIKHRLIHELKINEHFAPRVVVEAIQRITVNDDLNISDPSIPCNVQQFKAGDIIKLKRNKEWIKSTVSRVFAEALCVRTVLNGKYVFRWLEGNALSEGIRVRFPQQKSCSQYQFTFQNAHDKAAKIMRRFTDLQRFNIPFGNLVSSLPRCVECLDDALGSVQIGMAIRDDDWESVIPIQTVPIPAVFNVALISNHSKCFRISRFINMSRQNGRNGGKFSVISSSSIIIDANGGINGSGEVDGQRAWQAAGQHAHILDSAPLTKCFIKIVARQRSLTGQPLQLTGQRHAPDHI